MRELSLLLTRLWQGDIHRKRPFGVAGDPMQKGRHSKTRQMQTLCKVEALQYVTVLSMKPSHIHTKHIKKWLLRITLVAKNRFVG